MRERRLGDAGPLVSVVGLGCNNFGWRIDAEQAGRVVAAALDAGITLFDSAESYGGGESERFLGRALAGKRDEVVIATKFLS
jgi:aryl-alcohol dehydrogenase-like predicted oxidoreductase